MQSAPEKVKLSEQHKHTASEHFLKKGERAFSIVKIHVF